MSTDNRNRVRPGVSTGGQFATESKSEDSSIALGSTQPSSLDSAVATQLRDRLVKAATDKHEEVAKERRFRITSMYDHGHLRPLPTEAETKLAVERAENFASLPHSEQAEMAGNLAYLLEPGQEFGTQRIHLASDFRADSDHALIGLVAQRKLEESSVPGDITFISLEDGDATFKIDHFGVETQLKIRDNYASLDEYWDQEAEHQGADDYDWANRASTMLNDGGLAEMRPAYMADRVADYQGHLVAHKTMARSPLGRSKDTIWEVDHNRKTVELTATDEGSEFVIDLSGDTPQISTSNGVMLHPSMAAGFLDHYAGQEQHPDGQYVVTELKKVFEETDRILGKQGA